MRPADARLEKLLGAGAATFRATFDLAPDPVGLWWAIRDAAGAVIDFETANPAMCDLLGVSIEQSIGRRLLEESPAYAHEAAFKRGCEVVETCLPAIAES